MAARCTRAGTVQPGTRTGTAHHAQAWISLREAEVPSAQDASRPPGGSRSVQSPYGQSQRRGRSIPLPTMVEIPSVAFRQVQHRSARQFRTGAVTALRALYRHQMIFTRCLPRRVQCPPILFFEVLPILLVVPSGTHTITVPVYRKFVVLARTPFILSCYFIIFREEESERAFWMI